MKTFFFTWLSSIAPILALEMYLPTNGFGFSGAPVSRASQRVFNEAGRNPNLTHAVQFEMQVGDNRDAWTWRVNLTEVSVPNNISELGNPSADASLGLRIANTQWQLEWPGDKGFTEHLWDRGILNATISMQLSQQDPELLVKFNNDDGDCASLVGRECVRAIENSYRNGDQSIGDHLECNDLLIGSEASLTFPASKPQSSIAISANGQDSAFAFYTSETYSIDDKHSIFNQSKSQFHVLVISYEFPEDFQGVIDGPAVMCQVVQKPEVVEPPKTGPSAPPTATPNATASPPPESGAASCRHITITLWCIVLMCIVVVV